MEHLLDLLKEGGPAVAFLLAVGAMIERIMRNSAWITEHSAEHAERAAQHEHDSLIVAELGARIATLEAICRERHQ